jgi:hypothetical protein
MILKAYKRRVIEERRIVIGWPKHVKSGRRLKVPAGPLPRPRRRPAAAPSDLER